MTSLCPRCGRTVALHEGKPSITTTGAVQLWHATCWDQRDVPLVTRPLTVGGGTRVRQIPRAAVAGGAIAVFAVFAIARAAHGGGPTASLVDVDVPIVEHTAEAVRAASHEEPAPRPRSLTEQFPVPLENGQPLDELYSSLREWAHPVTASKELVPAQQSRWFGAERIGIERPECGAGHCGVDLDGPRGQPLVAVADGTVVRVERHELGLDGRSGRYVRIEHDDGTLTAYMHLDDIAEGLEVGDRVEAGEMIGTLGATAVYSAAPHCHFSLEVPNHPGEHVGDHSDTHYVDPAPFLARATVLAVPDRRHGRKPAM